jgi:hypothetical protein
MVRRMSYSHDKQFPSGSFLHCVTKAKPTTPLFTTRKEPKPLPEVAPLVIPWPLFGFFAGLQITALTAFTHLVTTSNKAVNAPQLSLNCLAIDTENTLRPLSHTSTPENCRATVANQGAWVSLGAFIDKKGKPSLFTLHEQLKRTILPFEANAVEASNNTKRKDPPIDFKMPASGINQQWQSIPVPITPNKSPNTFAVANTLLLNALNPNNKPIAAVLPKSPPFCGVFSLVSNQLRPVPKFVTDPSTCAKEAKFLRDKTLAEVVLRIDELGNVTVSGQPLHQQDASVQLAIAQALDGEKAR